MNALAIVGCTVGGAVAGGLVGGWIGSKEPGDAFGMAILLDGMAGLLVGGFIGCVVGAVKFA